jgi:hypothetical protein
LLYAFESGRKEGINENAVDDTRWEGIFRSGIIEFFHFKLGSCG